MGLVYTTGVGRICTGCQRPIATCACAASRKDSSVARGDGIVRLRRETQGRRGRSVTIVDGVPISAAELATLAKELKQCCGAGGTVADGRIEIQGDQRDKLEIDLQRRGFIVKRAGG